MCVTINNKRIGRMVQGILAYRKFVFMAGIEENLTLTEYNARSDNLIVQRDTVPISFVDDVIAEKSYVYYTDCHTTVVYRLGYHAFVAEPSGEDDGLVGGDAGGVGKNKVGVDVVLQIAMHDESFRKK